MLVVKQPAEQSVVPETSSHLGGRATRKMIGRVGTLTLVIVTLSALATVAPAYAKAPKVHKPHNPSGVVALPVEEGAAVSWTAPQNDGGSPITGYTAKATPGSATCTTSGALSCTITGLTDGHRYFIRVSASNSSGSGRDSLAGR